MSPKVSTEIEFQGRARLFGLVGPTWSKVCLSHDGIRFYDKDNLAILLAWNELEARTVRVDGGSDSATDDWYMEFKTSHNSVDLSYDELSDDHVRRLIVLVAHIIPDRSRLTMPRSIVSEYEGHATAAKQFLKKAKYREAEYALKEGLARCEREFGPDDPYVATMLETYALLLKRTGCLEEGQRMRQRADAIRANPWKLFDPAE
ncbi:MAG: hypothetical protein HY711_07370 [Candidatus Melainabacteria bacterium]|nr:hypothetical protein [Candidatus Melainabacteria bacterium]